MCTHTNKAACTMWLSCFLNGRYITVLLAHYMYIATCKNDANVCHNRDIIIRTWLILFFVAHSHQSTSPKSGDKPEPKRYGSCTRPFFPDPHTKEKKRSGYMRLPSNSVTVRHYLKGFILVFGLKNNSTPGPQFK